MCASARQDHALLEKAHRVLPGGSFGNTSADVIIRAGRGSRVWAKDGNEYVDYLTGSGPMLVGHAHPEVTAAVRAQIEHGTTFFANNRHGIDLAAAIVEAVPCADKVRYVSSGSEADAFAMRLARAYRGRDKILKFEGGYHGFSDYGLMSLAPQQSSASARPIPDSAGIPRGVADHMLVAPFNDVDAVASLIRDHKADIAAVFMEPFQRLIPPQPGFLEAVRELTQANDILLVFDEVVTGFRFAYGGAQEYYGVVPDICTLGKVIGGGFPLAAIAGRDEIMALFDRSRTQRDHYLPQIGTLSGNPVAAVAGLATLEILKRPGTYERLFETGRMLMSALSERLTAAGLEAQVVGEPPLFDVVFAAGDIRNYRDTLRADTTRMAQFNSLLREQGILKGDNKYYLSTSLTEADLEHTLGAWDEAIAVMTAS
jgi:glutamate-1-semialdehyde 2,1-aminomutase